MGEIEFTCPHCGQQMQGQEEWLGQAVSCPNCGQEIDLGGMPVQVEESPFGETPRLKEYKVLTQKDQWFSGKFDPATLEAALNAYASQGWRVVATATASFPGLLSANREEIIIILERDR
jgi:lysine biosynthesis protein LysW